MELMKKIWEAAKSNKKKIVLPEGNEERTIAAAQKIYDLGLAHPILVGDTNEILAKAKELDVDLSHVEIINPNEAENLQKYINAFYELRKAKGVTMEKAEKIVRDPLYFATMMVKLDDADGMVSGAVHTTGDLLRPGLQIIKTAPGVSCVSSFF
ncbi:phosphate acyltransferase, partial [Clostridium butyricum]